MLRGFFDAKYDELTQEQKSDFVDLLKEEDQDLFRWLVGQFEPEQIKIKNMVQLIRDYQKQSNDKPI